MIEEKSPDPLKSSLTGPLATGVAHDLKDMLIIINGYCDLLLHEESASPVQLLFLKEIYKAGECASSLIQQLLNAHGRASMALRTLDLPEMIMGMSRLLRSLAGEKVLLQVESTDDPLMVHADADRIGQVVLNLVLNARDAMPKGGRVNLRIEKRTIDDPFVARHPGAHAGVFVCLSVEDSGCGMSPELEARIRDPLFTTQKAGKEAGLGLAAVFGIVQEHGGWIQVESEQGKGTTFHVFLPVSAELSTVVAIPADDAKIRGGGETILLVEDDAAVRGLASIVLQKYGYRVLEAAHAEEALEVWKRHGHRTDLLFTDLVMTGEMTGKELAEQLQAGKPTLKIIYTSGYNAETGAKLFELKAGSSFIQKPYPPRILAETVRRILDGAKEDSHE